MFFQIPIEISTPSAIPIVATQIQEPSEVVKILDVLNKYAPLIGLVGGILAAVIVGLKFWGAIIEANVTLSNLSKDVKSLKPVVSTLNKCVDELQTTMRIKFKALTLVNETIDFYGERNSPIVLKDEFRTYIQKSGLANQIEEKKSDLIKWLKSKKPRTGLDAQEKIFDLVISDKIEKYLDTTEYKKLLYQDGKTTKDFYLILTIYLFEVVIPEVIKEELTSSTS